MYGIGFYKMLDDRLIYGRTVINKDFDIRLTSKDLYSYPIDGWYYCEGLDDAEVLLGIPAGIMEDIRNPEGEPPLDGPSGQ